MTELTGDEAVDLMRDINLATHKAMEAIFDAHPNISTQEKMALTMSATIKFLAAAIVSTSQMTGNDLGVYLGVTFHNIATMVHDMAERDRDGMQMH
jgi:uncharacterized membrane protein YadS